MKPCPHKKPWECLITLIATLLAALVFTILTHLLWEFITWLHEQFGIKYTGLVYASWVVIIAIIHLYSTEEKA